MSDAHEDAATDERSPDVLIFDQRLIEEKDYWTGRLANAGETSNLPLDYQRPESFNGESEVVKISLDNEVCRKLNKLTSNGDFLLYATLMAVLKICLHKYTGSTRIAVGSPARQKSKEPTRFKNALVILDDIDVQMPFREFLVNVRQTLLDAYAKQSYPFERLLGDLNLDGETVKCPLFDVALILQNIHTSLPEVKNDITISFVKEGDAITGTVAFNSALFEPRSIELFINHFLYVLEQALDNTAISTADIKMLTEGERRQLLEEWNPTVIRSEWQQCVHELFEAQVERTPQQVALVYEDYQLSYEELNSKANQLAHHLISLGIAPEQVVGLCLERSPEMVIALLAVLKAGAVYLPLDPHYPDRRLAQMAANSQLTLLITQQHLSSRLVALVPSGTQRLDIDAELQLISTGLVSNPQRRAYPGNLAYLIYTSGSTGEAKGVMVEHRGLCNLVEAQAHAFEVDEESRVLQFASLSFDASVSEVLVTLCSGGRLCMAGAQVVLAGGALEEVLRAQEVTVATLPPTLLRSINREALAGVRTLVSAGEACTAEIVERCGDGRRLLNAYGPTETSVCASISEALKSGERSRAVVPIGRAISNTQMYVLDERMELLPVGVAGELYIGGVGVARGYAGKAEQTAEKFVPHPFSSEPGARLYRTGDRGRVRGDGQVEYLGRLDSQVKVRGYRIELGEIEAALLEHAEVREAVVVVREEGVERRLVGYVVREEGGVASGSELRQHVKERLPEYMIPQWVVMMDEMPLTPNGKIDRKALRQNPRMEANAVVVAPRNEIERTIAEAWKDVLFLEEVGIHDNFFELGGHSLLMAEVLTKLQEIYGGDLTIVELFEYPTISSLAEYLSGAKDASNQTPEQGAELLERVKEGQDRQRLLLKQRQRE